MFNTPETRDDRAPIQFPNWSESLRQAQLPLGLREQHRRSILSFLRHCKVRRVWVSVAGMREYVTASKLEADRLALRWFYQASRAATPLSTPPNSTSKNGAVSAPGVMTAGPKLDNYELTGARNSAPKVPKLRSDVPPLAANDQGGADWERDLIKAMRCRGFLWRTEETYRSWAARFAQFLRPSSPYAATADDLGAFLTELAVKQRAMPATQKQALNALVFLLQEALNRQLGTIPFQRATPRRRMPTVLTTEECTRLLGK